MTPARLPFTAAQAVARAKSQIGYREKHSNRTKYGAAYRFDGVAWCGEFQWWVFYSLGVDIRRLGISAPVSTNAFDAAAARVGWQRISPVGIRPGDLLFFDFGDLDGPGPDTANDNDHVGMATSRPSRGYVMTVEGNTSSGKRGSQANGDGVWPRSRNLALIRHVYRPPYSSAAQVKALAKKRAAEEKARKAATARKKRAALLASKRAKAAAAALALALAAGGGTAAVKASDKPTPKPAPTSTRPPVRPPTKAIPKPTPRPTVKPKPRTTLTRTLRYSKGRPFQRGADVKRVQRLVGLKGKQVDGEYGPMTAARVRVWQARHGVKPTGVFSKVSAARAGWPWRP
jgi:peptidoglycan hydrolase-like protein with peptidoglycan-binding domain